VCGCGGALEVREWKIFDKIATWFSQVGLNVMGPWWMLQQHVASRASLSLPAGCARNVRDLPTCRNRAAKAGAKQMKYSRKPSDKQ